MDAVAQSESSMRALSADAPGHLKRKRSPSNDPGASSHVHPPPPQKTAKTSSNHLAINYLARQYTEDLPLVSAEDNIPAILALLNEYQGVLERHESLACNLGARPLGPILIKRFERLFDGPPRVLKCHGKEGTFVTWLDVVEFARNKPEQFTLGQMSEGVRVCQFYTKQCRVQISEEDYQLISSGIPQKLIPPQPIIEDEEKELGTLEILEKNLSNICHMADQVAARTRQLNHRLKARKQAILDRRASENGVGYTASSPPNAPLLNGSNGNSAGQSPVGFVAVNARQIEVDPSKNGASSATREELMNKFFSLSDKRAQTAAVNGEIPRKPSTTLPPISSSGTIGSNRLATADTTYPDYKNPFASSAPQASTLPPVPIPANASSLVMSPHTPASAGYAAVSTKDDGPFKSEMVARMESLKRGDRVIPPCDRCRRLHMDCQKNLTACVGCTRKHAKCSWKDVRESELRGNPVSADASDSDRERNSEASIGYPPHSNGLPSVPPNGNYPGIGGTFPLDPTAAASLAAAAQAASKLSASENQHIHYGRDSSTSGRIDTHQPASGRDSGYRLADEPRSTTEFKLSDRARDEERDRSSIPALIA